MATGYGAYLSAIALLMAAPVSVATAQSAASVADIAVPGGRRVLAVHLAGQVTDMLDKIARHYPNDAPFASLAPDVRLWLIGQGKDRMLEGATVQDALTTIFSNPDDEHHLVHGTPDVQIDGNFGRFKIAVDSRERGRPTGCLALYGDAILTGNRWSFVHLTVTRRSLECDTGS